jgi:heterodisulfide reductase subunit A
LRQATSIKQQAVDSEVFIFFRELYTSGGIYDELVWTAQQSDVQFVRFPAGNKPIPLNNKIDTFDELTNRQVRLVFDRIIIPQPPKPQAESAGLAKMLRLPRDQAGFMAETRIRLRPADYIERGIYVCGAVHTPNDRIRAEFEAYSAAARATHYVQRKQITSWAPAAAIDPSRCNGCGDCVKVCPFMAVTLEARPADARALAKDRPPLAVVDALTCTGCGNCVSACPVKAAQVASSFDEQLEAQMASALSKHNGSGPIERLLIFACEWSGYSAAEIAGTQQRSYPANTRIIRLNCTGRLQPGLLLKALEMGAAGVLVLGCAPGVCHFEQGNEHCQAMFEQTKALARLLALDQYLKLEWMTPDDPQRFIDLVKNFAEAIKHSPKQES